jgi:hypothetical protein
MKGRMSAFSLDGVRRCARSERQLLAITDIDANGDRLNLPAQWAGEGQGITDLA